jgi:hypothetical protein
MRRLYVYDKKRTRRSERVNSSSGWNSFPTSTGLVNNSGTNNRNCIHNEISLRPKTEIISYFIMPYLFKSKPKWNKINKTYTLYILYQWWHMHVSRYKRRRQKLIKYFEKKVLRRIDGLIYNPDTKDWEWRTNK